MKIIELNIGLSTPNGGKINPNEVLNALTGRGFNLITYRLQESTCKDGVETCLAVKTNAPDDWQSQLASLSDKLGQDCIAVVGFIGHSPYDAFIPSLWVTPEKTAQDEFNGYTKAEFIAYLPQIITDSRESGFDSYAEDLETALHFLKN